MKLLKFLLISLLAVTLYSCEYQIIEPEEVVIEIPEEGLSFETDILPIITSTSCTACHKSSNALDLTTADVYNEISTGVTSGKYGPADLPYLNLTSPDQSPLYTLPLGNDGHVKLYSATDAATLLAWIEDGAKNN
ncbi:MAG: hypothetical protein JXR58_04200 [Bacteroidales bacterium]|nr:hypothetical protein [Bacteroidales bacterium]